MENTSYISDAKGNFYAPFETELVTGYLPLDIPKVKELTLRWRGPKINLETEWYPATSFMFDYQKHEVVLRLFVTADKKSIVIRPLTQIYGTGMNVREAPTTEDRGEIMALGLTDVGSVHSHCTAKAFASGVDISDERNWPGGLHMTVGNLDEERYDLHARFAWDLPGLEENGQVVRKAQRILQTPYLADWFQLPGHVENFLREEEELEKEIVTYLLAKPVAAEYPAWWKEKLTEPPQNLWGSNQLLLDNPGEGGVYFKRRGKNKRGDDIDDFQRRRWTAWQRAMAILSDYSIVRENKWTVSDFSPQLRGQILDLHPLAKEILEKIQGEIKRLKLSEEDVFGSWNWESGISG